MQLRTLERARRRRPGFTLMEVLVVVAILVVLAGIGIGVFYYLDSAKDRAAYTQVKNLETAVDAYKALHDDYPESLEMLTESDGEKTAALSTQNLIDPWNRQYVYEPNNRHPKTGKPKIYSQGAKPGQSKQIANW
jgi:general secretion pathway protein G